MAAVSVTLPSSITSPQPRYEADIEAADVGEALRLVAARAPRFAQRLFYKDRLLVTVLVNGRLLPPADALARPLSDGDRIDVMPPVAGG